MKLRNISSYYTDRSGSRKISFFLSKLLKLRNFEIIHVVSWTESVRKKLSFSQQALKAMKL